MQNRWTTALLIALTVEGATCAAAAPRAADALSAVDECIARVDSVTATGFELIATQCPELLRRLQSSDWAAWLPQGWQNDYNILTARSLAALRMDVARELAARADARTPPVALVRPILADLAARNPPPNGWWERMRSWVRALFAPEPKPGANWYDRFSGRFSLSEALIEFVAYATFALVVILGLYIIVNEWRASGPQHRRSGTRSAARQVQPQSIQPSDWHDVERAAPNERPRVLLELIAARLTATQRLPVSGALTVRELTRAAELTDPADRERLDQLALTAERLRFAFAAPPPAGVARVLARGRELFDRLGDALAERT